MCTADDPWDGTVVPHTIVLHPDARPGDYTELDVTSSPIRERIVERYCPNCGFEWFKDVLQ